MRGRPHRLIISTQVRSDSCSFINDSHIIKTNQAKKKKKENNLELSLRWTILEVIGSYELRGLDSIF